MGIFGKLFEVLGFESAEKKVSRKSKKQQKVKASYNFKKKQKVEKIDNIDGIRVIYPEIFDDAKQYRDLVKQDQPFIISIEYSQKEELDKILSYFCGAIEMMGGELKLLEKDKYYVVLPEGMEIEE